MAKKKKQNKEKKNKKLRLGLMTDLRYGRTLSLDFFSRNAWIIMLFVVSIIILIGFRYKTKTRTEEIKKLNSELELAQSSKLQEKAAYMSLIRETEMKKLVEEQNLGLQLQETPPFELSLDD